ncbi:PIG-L deacetylase family protein [Variovorax ginsengisoli]|uniref:LmbE family N-acetylglucosaminyl deacetylase n=1 Tax=Variovorax ginsengisoli TaxID=363844 RepID=A0ABT9S0H7_9BURK|nr:PIG-L family deacetylase [Variovorax ginsengisoli]MDP9897850.1 LmbE family N-acetylglucosaminyl deacetylase [Variovorax ginsengisoli]
MATLNTRAIEGSGTSEAEWLGWPELAHLPEITVSALVPDDRRAVVVAPHPDDEVLSVGGMLALLGRLQRTPLLIAVTDGTASHAGSVEWPPERLAVERPLESEAAWHALGFPGLQAMRLGLPDGGLHALQHRLTDRLITVLRPHDVVFTTWRLDGHPDHEATGQACAIAAQEVGARLVEVPVWAWHWAHPGDARLPWARAQRLMLDAQAQQRKQAAVQAFRSQLHGDASTGAGPILRDTTVARAARPFELVFA